MDLCTYYSRNAVQAKVQESTITGLQFESESNSLVAVSDFGFLHLYDISNLSELPVASKTLRIQMGRTQAPLRCCSLEGSGPAKRLFCGGKGGVHIWNWDSILQCSHMNSISADTVMTSDRSYDMHSNSPQINEFAVSSNSGHLYAGGSDGLVYVFDVETGKYLNDISAKRQQSIHSVKVPVAAQHLLVSCDDEGVVNVWDVRTGYRSPASRCDFSSAISDANVTPRGHSLWSACMDVDAEGNFIYVGGGSEGVSQPFSHRSGGWVASALVGGGNGEGIVVSSASCPSAVQQIQVDGAEIITGGAQSSLTYLYRSSLEQVSISPTSSPSIVSIAIHPDPNKELLAVGGMFPAVDIFAVRGHKAATLHPVV